MEFWGAMNRSGLSPETPLEEGEASWPHRAQPMPGWGPVLLPRWGLQKAGDLGSPGCLCSAGGWMFELARPEGICQQTGTTGRLGHHED